MSFQEAVFCRTGARMHVCIAKPHVMFGGCGTGIPLGHWNRRIPLPKSPHDIHQFYPKAMVCCYMLWVRDIGWSISSTMIFAICNHPGVYRFFCFLVIVAVAYTDPAHFLMYSSILMAYQQSSKVTWIWTIMTHVALPVINKHELAKDKQTKAYVMRY